jgi:hypothetical protein
MQKPPEEQPSPGCGQALPGKRGGKARALSTTASLPRASQHSASDASSYANDHRADYFRAALVGSVRHLWVVESLDEPLLPARTAQAAATVGAMFKFLRFQMIANIPGCFHCPPSRVQPARISLVRNREPCRPSTNDKRRGELSGRSFHM